MTPAQVPTTTDLPLWLVALCIVLAFGPLAWMAHAWFREWQDWRAGVPLSDPEPIPPTLHQPWRWRMLLVYAVQAWAIGQATIGMANDLGWERVLVFLAMNTILVAFATAVLTRLWDVSVAALARRRPPGRQRQ